MVLLTCVRTPPGPRPRPPPSVDGADSGAGIAAPAALGHHPSPRGWDVVPRVAVAPAARPRVAAPRVDGARVDGPRVDGSRVATRHSSMPARTASSDHRFITGCGTSAATPRVRTTLVPQTAERCAKTSHTSCRRVAVRAQHRARSRAAALRLGRAGRRANDCLKYVIGARHNPSLRSASYCTPAIRDKRSRTETSRVRPRRRRRKAPPPGRRTPERLNARSWGRAGRAQEMGRLTCPERAASRRGRRRRCERRPSGAI